MKDHERLKLMKIICGAKVYEEHLRKSFEILQDTISRRKAIEKLLSCIETKIFKLGEEMEKINEFHSFLKLNCSENFKFGVCKKATKSEFNKIGPYVLKLRQ